MTKKNKSVLNKKQLTDLYKQHPDADAFIKEHLAEFSEESYNDLTAIKPEVIKIKDMSIIVQNVHLLKRKKNINLLNDYFSGKTPEQLLAKYRYKTINSLRRCIVFLKELIKKRFEENIEKQFSLENKKVDANELNNKVKDITLNLTRNQVKVALVRVKIKNKLNYKFFDEDVNLLYKKADMLKLHLTEPEFKTVSKVLNKYPVSKELSFRYFEDIKNILSRYRWVNEDGFFLPKVLDDAITEVLTYNENKTYVIHELFQGFN